MKVLLIGNYKPDKQESMHRFAELLWREIRIQGHQVRLIRPAVVFNLPLPALKRISKWLGYLDKFVLFPFVLRLVCRWADVIHICDHSNSLYVFILPRKPQVIVCHDLLAIRSALGQNIDVPTRGSGKILQNIILQGINHANRIICVSNNTLKELLQVSRVDPGIASVIYNGINYPYKPSLNYESWQLINKTLGRNNTLGDNFLLHVGGNHWYKNRLGVLRIYQQLRQLNGDEPSPKLVMAGHPLDDSMRDFIAQNGLQDAVIEVQGCSNEALQALYSMAEAMLFPSLAEGFGWPVVEAQACGCRVVTSNFAPLTEIGGEAAIYCDPRDEVAVARALQALLGEDAAARLRRVESGICNAARFSAQKMTEDYLAIYREEIEAASARRL